MNMATHIARKPIQLGNDELGAIHPAGLDSLGELGAIIALPALNLGKFLHQRPVAAIQELGDRIALRLDAETGFALPIGRNPEVADPFSVRHVPAPNLSTGVD